MTEGRTPSRRSALAGMVAGALASGAAPLRAQNKQMQYGVAAMKENFIEDERYRSALIKYCDVIVPMNDLKWEALRPKRDVFAFEDADRILNFARENGKSTRGHALCWYQALPGWAKTISSRAEAEAELRRHIETVVSRYRGQIPSWDVVNEAIAHDPARQGPWRDGLWQQQLGREHIDIAFQAAAMADPKADLVYNDYDYENDDPRQEMRRQITLDLVRHLQKKKIPIHAIGFQAHLYAERPIAYDGIFKFVSELKKLGVKAIVTELDVIDWRLPGLDQERDKAAARHVREFLTAITAAAPLETLITWGITDRYSWIAETFKRADKLPVRPLPLDREYKPKQMMQVLQEFRTRQ